LELEKQLAAEAKKRMAAEGKARHEGRERILYPEQCEEGKSRTGEVESVPCQGPAQHAWSKGDK